MILFAGEYIGNACDFSIRPPTTTIQNRAWDQLNSKHANIYYCDFSSTKTHHFLDGEIFIALSGNPVIDDHEKSKKDQIEALRNSLLNNTLCELFKNTNGVFCSALHNRGSDELVLVTDYIGLRQIYLYQDSERTIFSNVLWLLKEIIHRPLTIDVDSIVETGTLGHPLDNRTKFKEIEILAPGCTLRLLPENDAITTQYIDISSTPPQQSITETEAVHALYEIWKNAVFDRIDGQKDVFGFLSGGMDSRLLLHTLKLLGCNIHSANFAPPGSRDLVFGKLASEHIGTVHFENPIDNLFKDLAIDTIRSWREAEPSRSNFFDTKSLIWSGDGGSVGLGHVYLTDNISSLAAQNDFFGCAESFCKENSRQVPSRLFKDKSAMSKLIERIASLMLRYGTTNAERAPYYFLMLNDQRRHMDHHYESFHKRGFDFSLPFFDKRLITFVSSLPANWVNNHRLYDNLFQLIGGSLTASAWQTYPGHVPCKLDIPAGLTYQWEPSFYSSKNSKRFAAEEARACVRFVLANPATPFSRIYTILTLTMTALRISNRGYITKYIKPLI